MAKKESGNKDNPSVSIAVTEDSLSYDQLSGNTAKLPQSAKSPLGLTYKELHEGLEETITFTSLEYTSIQLLDSSLVDHTKTSWFNNKFVISFIVLMIPIY